MKRLIQFGTSFTLVAFALWSAGGPTAGQNPPPADGVNPAPAEGIEVEAHGPIHEAFAQPVLRRQAPAPPVPKQPPDPVEEMPPDQKPADPNVIWIPGYWAWDDVGAQFLWVSGIWRVPPPGMHWVPGYWMQSADGWQWTSGYWTSVEETSIELYPPPPDPLPEAIPVAPNDESIYAPGCWVFRETRYVWRPGYWVGLRPGWIWINAGYFWTPGGYVFIDGHWDYDLSRRGLCFAPVAIDLRLVRRPGWFYRPAYVVETDFLIGSLFVNIGQGHYFFGDYYDAAFVRRGYQPWVDFRVGQHFYDPLFTYYRWRYRSDPAWERDLRRVYEARREGSMPRPPRTLAEQQRVAAAPGAKQVRAVASLTQIQQTTNIKLQQVTNVQAQQFRKTAEHFQTLRQERSTVEHKAHAQAPEKREAPVKIALPKPKEGFHTPTGAQAPPPRPTLPQTVTRPAEIGGKTAPKEPARPKELVNPKEPGRPAIAPRELPNTREPAELPPREPLKSKEPAKSKDTVAPRQLPNTREPSVLPPVQTPKPGEPVAPRTLPNSREPSALPRESAVPKEPIRPKETPTPRDLPREPVAPRPPIATPKEPIQPKEPTIPREPVLPREKPRPEEKKEKKEKGIPEQAAIALEQAFQLAWLGDFNIHGPAWRRWQPLSVHRVSAKQGELSCSI